MDGASITILYACIIVVLTVCSAFFSLTETAFTGANRVRLKKMANDGDKRADRALAMLEDYDKFLTTNLIGVNVVNIASTTVASVMFLALFGDLGSIVNIVVMTLVSLTFCEIIPKSVAKKSPEKWCVKTCGVFAVLLKILSPISWLFTKLTKAIGEDENVSMSDEELEVLIDECEDDGILKDTESELIKSAIRFDDVQVRELCVPRMDVTAISQDATEGDLADVISSTGFSRIPVYNGTIDDIIGVVYAKEYYAKEHKGEPCGIQDIMKPVKYVPESMRASELLSDFQRTKVHMAVILDSYGGTIGIITLEDVLEALVGEIWDESDEIQEDIVSNTDGSLTVKGSASVFDVMETLGRDFSLGGYDEHSVTGYIMYRIGRPPLAGDEVDTDGVVFRVTSVDGHRVKECRVVDHRAPPDESAE